jgi:hypothetical protein
MKKETTKMFNKSRTVPIMETDIMTILEMSGLPSNIWDKWNPLALIGYTETNGKINQDSHLSLIVSWIAF